MTPVARWWSSGRTSASCWPASFPGALAARNRTSRACTRGYRSSGTGSTRYCSSSEGVTHTFAALCTYNESCFRTIKRDAFRKAEKPNVQCSVLRWKWRKKNCWFVFNWLRCHQKWKHWSVDEIGKNVEEILNRYRSWYFIDRSIQ